MSLYKDTIKGIALLVGIAIIISVIVNILSPKGIAFFGDYTTGVPDPVQKNSHISHDREIYSVKAVKEIFDSGEATFVDARTVEAYEEGHIKGAKSFPVNDFLDLIDMFIDETEKDVLIISYCSGRECDDSHKLAQYLEDEGFKNIKVFVDGYPAWEKEGFPVE